MSNKTLVGRQGEVELLNSYLKSDKSEFIAVYGRRRVGKTFLIRQTIADRACFMLTGMDNVGVEEQLTNFTMQRYIFFLKQPNFLAYKLLKLLPKTSFQQIITL